MWWGIKWLLNNQKAGSVQQLAVTLLYIVHSYPLFVLLWLRHPTCNDYWLTLFVEINPIPKLKDRLTCLYVQLGFYRSVTCVDLVEKCVMFKRHYVFTCAI